MIPRETAEQTPAERVRAASELTDFAVAALRSRLVREGKDEAAIEAAIESWRLGDGTHHHVACFRERPLTPR